MSSNYDGNKDYKSPSVPPAHPPYHFGPSGPSDASELSGYSEYNSNGFSISQRRMNSGSPATTARDLAADPRLTNRSMGLPHYLNINRDTDEPLSYSSRTATPSEGTPRVVLPPIQGSRRSIMQTPTNGQGRGLPQLSRLPTPRIASPDFSSPGFSPPRVSPPRYGRSATRTPDLPPSNRQIVTDPRQVLVDSPTFNAVFAPMQTRPGYQQQPEYQQDEESPQTTPTARHKILLRRLRHSHKASSSILSEERIRNQRIMDEKAKGFEDDDDFYPRDQESDQDDD